MIASSACKQISINQSFCYIFYQVKRESEAKHRIWGKAPNCRFWPSFYSFLYLLQCCILVAFLSKSSFANLTLVGMSLFHASASGCSSTFVTLRQNAGFLWSASCTRWFSWRFAEDSLRSRSTRVSKANRDVDIGSSGYWDSAAIFDFCGEFCSPMLTWKTSSHRTCGNAKSFWEEPRTTHV